jgi:serine/threonine protein kinase
MAKQTLFCKTVVHEMLKKREPLFSGWRLCEFLGAGVSGCVFKMEREDLGQKFLAALKVIPLTRKIDRENSSIESLKESIAQEAREIVHLYSLGNHQNLVGWYNHEILYELDKDSATALVAVMMEFLPQTLADYIKEGPLPWEQAVRLTIDCLKGLEHVHAASIIHRDIKPGNIFVTTDGRGKLGDFGVARKLAEREQAETRVGTPLYIAPEVVKDPLGHGYAYQADVYSIGLVLFEMLTGKLPFESVCQGNRNCMVNKRLSGEAFNLERQLPTGVTIATLGALAYNPSLRYATATEFREALEKTLATDGRETLKPKAVEQIASQATAKGTGQGASRLDKPKNLRTMSSSRPGAGPDLDDEDEFIVTSPKNAPKKNVYAGEYPSAKDSIKNARLDSEINQGFQNPLVIILLAIVACGLAYLLRDKDMLFGLVLALFYLALPLYYIIARTSTALLSIGAFFISLCVYNFLYIGRIEGIFDTVAISFLSLYLLVYGVSYWVKRK